MDERRGQEYFLVLVEVDLRRDDGDEQGDQAPGGQPWNPGTRRRAPRAISNTPLISTRSRWKGR